MNRQRLSDRSFAITHPIAVTACAFVCLMVVSLPAYAAALTVPGDHSTIQAAIDAAVDGDEIIVSPGTYVENINFNGKNIILRSIDPTDPDVVASTIIDGNQSGSVVTFAGTETADCGLSGFTITDGSAEYGGGVYNPGASVLLANCTFSSNYAVYRGGGIYNEGCSPILMECAFEGNWTSEDGGGMYNRSASPRVTNCSFVENLAPSGGGMRMQNSYATIQSCTFARNRATAEPQAAYLKVYGGAMTISGGSPTIQTCLFEENVAEDNAISKLLGYGGALSISGSSPTIINCVFTRNAAGSRTGTVHCSSESNVRVINCTFASNTTVGMGGALFNTYHSRVTASNCIFWPDWPSDSEIHGGETTITYSDGRGLEGSGNVNADPRFVDAESGDLHLLADSPCVDAGCYVEGLTEDFEGDPRGLDGSPEARGDGSDFDMGADEHVPADTDDDGLLDWWEELHFGDLSYGPYDDYDGDGLTNIDEYVNRANPTEQDTDGDGLIDGEEVHTYLTEPDDADTDDDGLIDGEEVNDYLTDPVDADTDDDGIPDGWEVSNGFDPNDSTGDNGADADPDGDGLVNVEEYTAGADPHNADTDGDGLTDGMEVHLYSTDPLDADSDDDTLTDADEVNTYSTDPNESDTDNDGFSDGWEIAAGTDPNDENDTPTIILIQDMIDAAVDGDEVIVPPGWYFENINFNGKNIILRSVDPTDPDVVASTVINGGGSGSVVTFAGTETPECVLSGFTITNGDCTGSHEYDDGGGIRGNRTLATIRNNTVSDSYAHTGGGIDGCDGTIMGNTISNNSAVYGGGLSSCNGTIKGNVITGNSGGRGGGLDVCHGVIQDNIISGNDGSGVSSCDGTIQSNVISENSGGGLIWCDGTIQNNIVSGNLGVGVAGCDGPIINNTIAGNSSEYYGGISDCDGLIANCIIWGNSGEGDQVTYSSAPVYSCIQDWTGGGQGNISSDPRFVDPDDGDYHLLADSPCIDAGNVHYLYYFSGEYIADGYGEVRLIGSSIDMAGDEFGSSLDRDGDLLSDADESLYGSDPDIADTDGDQLADGIEVLRGTDPVAIDVAAGISVPAEFSSIQGAIFAAFPHESITVSPGIYQEILHSKGKEIILSSTDPTNRHVVASTIIDGNHSGSVVTFAGTESPDCVLAGFTITSGDASYSGGGISGNGTLAAIRNNIISNNTAGYYGGGIDNCDGTIQSNMISGNRTTYCIHGAEVPMCVDGGGGGLYHCSGTIMNNVIAGNHSAYCGGGLYGCLALIQNNTVWGNSAAYWGSGLYGCKGSISNCIIWANTIHESTDPTYCCIQIWTAGGIGNISLDPQLVDPEGGDFHLKFSSPCIDAGVYVEGLTEDFEGDPRGYDGTAAPRGDGSDYDIGADEWARDKDSDGLPDEWEEAYFGDLSHGPDEDYESDGLTNIDEYLNGTDPTTQDSDGDGLGDGDEVNTYLTDPTERDTDGDGLTDGEEVNDYFTDPLDADTDDDGMPDGWEITNSFDPNDPTGDNGGGGDPDRDGLINGDEYFNGTDPHDPDTDNDGLDDDEEVHLYFTDPLDEDTDDDWLLDGEEVDTYSTDPLEGDTDGDGFLDGMEIDAGTDPNDENDRPPSIQERIDAAAGGDVIIVPRGRYFENITFGGKNIVLQSTDPENPELVANTIIDGSGAGSVVTFAGSETRDCVLSGFTVTNGYAVEGGGIYNPGASPTITHCVFTGNEAELRGGGMENYGGSPYVNRCTFRGNAATGWQAKGGGMANGAYTTATITNCVFAANWAQYGGGMSNEYSLASISSCTFWGNEVYYTGQGIANFDSPDLIVTNCIVWDGMILGQVRPTVTYSDIRGGCACEGEGNIDADPLFVDPENGDFHLLPRSPCIDAGAYIDGLIEDFDGHPRGYDGTDESRGDGSDYDIGADEYMPGYVPDRDGDELPDWAETGTGRYVDERDTGTDPDNHDTDADGLSDGDEVYSYSTDPNVADSDDDGYLDGIEVAHGSDPLDAASVPKLTRGGAGGPCFIATAAYGTPAAREVTVFRDFRDEYLLTSRAGTAFVRAYYRLSPQVARFVAAHEPVRATLRACLTPIAAILRVTVQHPRALNLIAFGVGLFGVFALASSMYLFRIRCRARHGASSRRRRSYLSF
jgi:hypothetical protein